jgi:hypothetical protein
MPDIPGRMNHKGYISPAPGTHSKKYANILNAVYGDCRVNHPGEISSNKEYCAKVAHTVARRVAEK